MRDKCGKGHQLTDDNVYIINGAVRLCRQCHLLRQRRSYYHRAVVAAGAILQNGQYSCPVCGIMSVSAEYMWHHYGKAGCSVASRTLDIVMRPKCKCGCGTLLTKTASGKYNLYIRGHNRRELRRKHGSIHRD